jgi:maleylpyruvate isomerase
MNLDLQHARPRHDPADGILALTRAQQDLLDSVSGLSDDDLRLPSGLAGWSRGHVTAHLCRSADALRNVLIGAETGTPRPMYPNPQSRDDDIARDGVRPAVVQIADLDRSGTDLLAHARRLSAAVWDVPVTLRTGRVSPAGRLLTHRLTEVLIHHVDLAVGYTSAMWPYEAAPQLLVQLVGDLAERTDHPPVEVLALDTGDRYRIGGMPGAPVRVRGLTHELVAWLSGRGVSEDLTCEPGPLPQLPAWM